MVWFTQTLCTQQAHKVAKTQLQKTVKPASERALEYVEKAPRVRLQDLEDNPGARTVVCILNLYTYLVILLLGGIGNASVCIDFLW